MQRTPLAVVLVAVGLMGAACGGPPPQQDCVEQVVAPNYPPIAAAARVTVEGIEALVAVDEGHIRGVTATLPKEAERGGGKLFLTAVENAVNRSQFKGMCRNAHVLYDFVNAAATNDPDPPSTQRAAFRPPNRIIVSITPALINISKAPQTAMRVASRRIAGVDAGRTAGSHVCRHNRRPDRDGRRDRSSVWGEAPRAE